MSRWRRHLRAAANSTEPRAGAVERIRTRATWPAHLLQQAGIEPRAGAIERLRRRAPRRRSYRWVLLLPVLAAVLWVVRPPAALSERLSALSPTQRELTELVRLDYHGAGTVDGTERTPHIRWEAGTLGVEVTPGAGVDLSVETDEALVRVVGTAFTVTRDAMGTKVIVTRGHVRVACTGAASTDLNAGQQAECVPVRAAAWIGRVQALMAAARPVDEILASVDYGLSLAVPGDPAAGELVALRIRVLMDSGRYNEALAAAQSYLASGAAPRRPEVEALATELRSRP